MKISRFLIRALFPLLAALSAPCAEGPQVFAIRNARIVPVSRAPIEKGTVVVRDGLIEAVGANIEAPADAWVIDGAGLTVYPGLIDACSTWGIPGATPVATPTTPRTTTATTSSTVTITTPVKVIMGPEDRPSNTSYVKAADEIVPTDRTIEAARNTGFTTAITFPNPNIFAGQGAVFDLGGDRLGQMIVNPSAGLYINFNGNSGRTGARQFPGSVMGVIAYIRQIYLDADHYKLANEIYAKHPQGLQRPAYDRTLVAVLESPRILLPATREVEIDRMIRYGQELKRPNVIYGGAEAFRAADLLKQSKTPILVNLRWPERPLTADPDNPDMLHVLEMRDKAPSGPGLLAAAGVKFALYAGSLTSPREVTRAVKRAIDAGLSPADALRAMTLSPAEIFNVADRLGSIDKGKIANLVITDGEMFQEKTKVKYVFVDGVKYEPTADTGTPRVTGESAQ
jgi:hypothetical protein